MTLNLTFTQEQADALAGVIAGENAALPAGSTAFTDDSYLTHVLMFAVDGYVATAYERAVQRIGNAAAALPYEERQALISQLETQLNP